MAKKRERKLPPEFFRKFIEVYDIRSTDDIKEALKDMIGGTMQDMLGSEPDENLDYGRYDTENKKTETQARMPSAP